MDARTQIDEELTETGSEERLLNRPRLDYLCAYTRLAKHFVYEI